MSEITLLRHGQASFGSDNYDQLSPIGHQQAVILGQHWRRLEKEFDYILTGTMQRHNETAAGVLKGLQRDYTLDTHAGLNEYNFKILIEKLTAQAPERLGKTGHALRDYVHNIKLALLMWMEGDIDTDGQDSWIGFKERILEAFHQASSSDAKRVLIVTSGGPISVVLQHILGLANADTVKHSVQIKNASTCALLYNRVDFTVDSFNDVSHFNTPETKEFITFS